jgi:hypothetical protein
VSCSAFFLLRILCALLRFISSFAALFFVLRMVDSREKNALRGSGERKDADA